MTRTSAHACVFCDTRGRLSKEHIFSRWLQDIVPKSGLSRHEVRHAHGDQHPRAATPRKGKLSRPGDLLAQTLRIACKGCNETWMSQVVNEARPTVAALVSGRWPQLTRTSAAQLATWAVLTTIVLEFADDTTRTTTPIERRFIRSHKAPPPNWRVWIAPHDHSQLGDASVWSWHRSCKVASAGEDYPARPNAQVTIAGLGGLALLVASTSFDGRLIRGIPAKHGPFRAVWPPRLIQPKRPAAAVSSHQSEALADEFLEYIARAASNCP